MKSFIQFLTESKVKIPALDLLTKVSKIFKSTYMSPLEGEKDRDYKYYGRFTLNLKNPPDKEDLDLYSNVVDDAMSKLGLNFKRNAQWFLLDKGIRFSLEDTGYSWSKTQFLLEIQIEDSVSDSSIEQLVNLLKTVKVLANDTYTKEKQIYDRFAKVANALKSIKISPKMFKSWNYYYNGNDLYINDTKIPEDLKPKLYDALKNTDFNLVDVYGSEEFVQKKYRPYFDKYQRFWMK